VFLTSAVDRDEWPFTLWDRAHGTQGTGGWVNFRAVLDAVAKRKQIHAPAGNQTSVVQHVAYMVHLKHRTFI
jgi:hypothetical protein